MGMTYKELRKGSDRVLIEWHDKEAAYDFTQSECREELSMRRMQRQTTVMLWLTILIAILTAAVTATTILNLLAVDFCG